MSFEDWLEEEFPAHSEHDFDSKGAYESWKRNLEKAFNAGWNKAVELYCW